MRISARGCHISPVSPKPCNSSTAGPDPPTRTCNVPPVTAMSRALKFAEDGLTSASALAGTPPASATAKSDASTGAEHVQGCRLSARGMLCSYLLLPDLQASLQGG